MTLKQITTGMLMLLLLVWMTGCHQSEKKQQHYISPAVSESVHARFALKDVDNKIDPNCMMPLTAGIGDTLHYQGYIIGFCSKGCKDEFLKDPKANLSLAQIKRRTPK